MVAADVHRRRRSGVRGPDPAVGLPSSGGCPARLDIGCGEGQVARRIAELGAEVIGLDPSATQALEAQGVAGDRATHGGAEALPSRSAAFDAVVACLAFEHVDAIDSRCAKSRGCSSRAAGSCCSSGTRCSRLRAAAGSTTRPPPSTTGASGVSRRAGRDRRGRARRETAVRAPSGQPLRAGDRRRGLAHRRHGRTRTAGRAAPPVWQFPEAATIPRLLLIRARRR